MTFRDVGHGHVWERPDGVKARCGGPGLCTECANDEMRLREVRQLFTDPIDIAIMVRAKDMHQTSAMNLEKRVRELEDALRQIEIKYAAIMKDPPEWVGISDEGLKYAREAWYGASLIARPALEKPYAGGSA